MTSWKLKMPWPEWMFESVGDFFTRGCVDAAIYYFIKGKLSTSCSDWLFPFTCLVYL